MSSVGRSSGKVASVRSETGVAVLLLNGVQGLFTAARLAAEIAAAVDRRHALVIDLRKVSLADSAIFGILISGRRHLSELGLPFVLVIGENRAIEHKLEHLGVAHLFQTVPTHRAAATIVAPYADGTLTRAA